MSLSPVHAATLVAAFASIIVRFGDIQSMAHGSDAVVHAMVTDQSVVRDEIGRILTWTELTVVDARSAQGHPIATHPQLWLAQLGGSDGGETVTVPGASALSVGEEVVACVMAMDRWPGVIIPHTFGAGVFRVQGPLSEVRGDIVDVHGRTPKARVVDDIETFWRQTGLVDARHWP